MSAGSFVRLLPWRNRTLATAPQAGQLPSDCSLLAMFVAGDQDAFASLMQRHTGLVMAVCTRILRNSTDAEDAFQATFLVLARKAGSLQWQDGIAGWLHQTARRTSLKLRSMTHRRSQIEQEAARQRDDVTVSVRVADQKATVQELAEILDEELDRLPLRFREAVLLTQVEGLSREVAAQRLGISEAAVKDRLERGREQLRSRLLRRGITLSGTLLATWLVPGTTHAATTTLVASTAEFAGVFATGSLASGTVPTAVSLAQGVLKMMGFEKVRFVAACLLSVVTAGGIAYGMLHDEPQRFQKGLIGQIIDVQSRSQPATVTIQLEEFDTLLNLDVAEEVKVWKAYEASDLSKVRPGQFVSLRLSSDHRTVHEIHVSGPQVEVAIQGIADSGVITAELSDDNDIGNDRPMEPHVYQLAPDAILRIGGLPAVRDDFKPGMEVPLELAEDGATIHAIEAEADPDSMIVGQILKTDAAAGTFMVQTEDDDDQTLTIPMLVTPETLIEVDGKRSTPTAILPGSDVIIRTSIDRQTARAIRATNPEPEDVDDDAEVN